MIMMRTILVGILFLGIPVWGQATTYYINDTGSDANLGTSAVTPWLSWAYAFAKSTCGDQLIVMDGIYTTTENGAFSLKKVCTVGTAYTVIAQNERKALLNGDGKTVPLLISNSAYITVQGLRVKNSDNAQGLANSNVYVANSNHITLRRLLVSHNNRYFNDHLIQLTRSPYSLVEENELYYFHRHAIILHGTSNSIVRRNYCHARNYADISGGFPSGAASTGDDCGVVYPGNDNIIENNIADGPLLKGFAVQALGAGRGNGFYGNISIGADIGVSLDVRGTGLSMMPRDTLIENMVVVGPSSMGIRSRGAKNTQCNHCMVLSTKNGIAADTVAGEPGDGDYSFFSNNSLVSGSSAGTGFAVTSEIQTWTVNNSNSVNNMRDYTPVQNSRFVDYKTVDPILGSCRVWIPDTSPMKKIGTNGKDIGANILYRYENGTLTKVPLWDRSTGEFPHGAIVDGVNDVAGQSLFDVHKRLNVNANGCSFPANYGSDRSSDEAAPARPVGLQAS
jgi:hypothetical protein